MIYLIYPYIQDVLSVTANSIQLNITDQQLSALYSVKCLLCLQVSFVLHSPSLGP